MENQKAAEQYFRAFERWDLETVESLVAEGAIEGRPQSGERFLGRTNIMGMLHALPSEPQISWRSIRGGRACGPRKASSTVEESCASCCTAFVMMMGMALPERLASAAARTELASILREFAGMDGPADSIGDRAVRIGTYNRDTAVLVPLADFERALETEELLDDLLLELTVAERLAAGPGGPLIPLDDVIRELGLAKEFGLE